MLESKLIKVVAKIARMQPEEISLETEIESLGINSVGMAELMFELEEEFSIQFPEEADITKRFDKVKTVRDLLNIINAIVDKDDKK